MYTPNKDTFIQKSKVRKFVNMKAAQSRSNSGRWCKKHPFSYWGKTKYGGYFSKCAEGFKMNESCEVGE